MFGHVNPEADQSGAMHQRQSRAARTPLGKDSGVSSLVALQRLAGNGAVTGLIAGRGSLVSVQRRGVLAQIANGGTIEWDAILQEIREEYAIDADVAGNLEMVYWTLNGDAATTIADVNTQLIIPLNTAITNAAAGQATARAAAQAAQERARWRSEVLANSKQMTVVQPGHRILIAPLINKWDLDEETSTVKNDQMWSLPQREVQALGASSDVVNGSHNKQGNCYRIDREGPAQGGRAAQFRLQLGTATYAGIHLQLNQTFSADYIREAWMASYNAGRTVWVHK